MGVGRNFEKLTDAAGRHDVYRMMVTRHLESGGFHAF